MLRIYITTIFLLFTIINIRSQEKTKVLLLATYHFGGNTNDDLKVTGDNILGDKKQKEIHTVIKKLKKFKPEKIYVENEPNRQKYWDSIYSDYKSGQGIQLEDEIFQIGIKLAKELNLRHGVTCVDWHVRPAKSFFEKQYEELLKNVVNYYDDNNIPDTEPRSSDLKETLRKINSFNEIIPELELLDVFQALNSEKHLDTMFYASISSSLDVDKYNMNVFWSQKNMIRNVNIYQNIIKDILEDEPKKAVIIFGSSHIRALRNYLEVHPKIEIVNTEEYLK